MKLPTNYYSSRRDLSPPKEHIPLLICVPTFVIRALTNFRFLGYFIFYFECILSTTELLTY